MSSRMRKCWEVSKLQQTEYVLKHQVKHNLLTAKWQRYTQAINDNARLLETQPEDISAKKLINVSSVYRGSHTN